jgi:hypothetical protein
MDQALEPFWLRISLIVAFGFITGTAYHRPAQIASSFFPRRSTAAMIRPENVANT